MLLPLRLGDGGMTVTLGPPSSALSMLAASCFLDAVLAPTPARSSLFFAELTELMLIDGFRLDDDGDCGDDCALELREWLPDGFTSFDRNPGAMVSASHRRYVLACAQLSDSAALTKCHSVRLVLRGSYARAAGAQLYSSHGNAK